MFIVQSRQNWSPPGGGITINPSPKRPMSHQPIFPNPYNPQFSDHSSFHNIRESGDDTLSDTSILDTQSHFSMESQPYVAVPGSSRAEEKRPMQPPPQFQSSKTGRTSPVPPPRPPEPPGIPPIPPGIHIPQPFVTDAYLRTHPGSYPTIHRLKDTGVASLPMAGTKDAPKTFKGKYSKIKDFIKHYEKLCEVKLIHDDQDKIENIGQYCSERVRLLMEGLPSFTCQN